jgi:UDP-3-O-[3-hydroxymyristoyl] glucosamine N-acyltransferase
MKLSDYFIAPQLIRDAEIEITHYANQSMDGIVCFVLNESFLAIANANKGVKAVITTSNLADSVDISKGLVVCESPKSAYYNFHNFMYESGQKQFIHISQIDSTAKIAKTAIIEEGVIIGKDVVIDEYAVIKSQSIIGEGTYIGTHVTIGARGMHNTRVGNEFMHVYDAGGVKIGKNCEVLSGAVVQKSYHFEMTEIGDQSKISVRVTVGHGAKVGQRTLVAGNAQIAGYVTIGDDVWIGPSATISHGLTIGSNAEVKLGSVVVKNVKEGEVVSGNFAYNHLKRIRNFAKEQR